MTLVSYEQLLRAPCREPDLVSPVDGASNQIGAGILDPQPQLQTRSNWDQAKNVLIEGAPRYLFLLSMVGVGLRPLIALTSCRFVPT